MTVTAPDGFAQSIERIALVIPSGAPQLDCPDVIKRVTGTIKTELKLKLEIVADSRVREELFNLGAAEFKVENREALATASDLHALLEIDISFAERGDGYEGRRGSETKVEMLLVRPTGEILMSGTGFGRPMNVVTSPERVADRTVDEVLENAVGRRWGVAARLARRLSYRSSGRQALALPPLRAGSDGRTLYVRIFQQQRRRARDRKGVRA